MFFVFVFPEKKKAKNCDFPEIQFPLTVSLFSRTVKSDSPKNVKKSVLFGESKSCSATNAD